MSSNSIYVFKMLHSHVNPSLVYLFFNSVFQMVLSMVKNVRQHYLNDSGLHVKHIYRLVNKGSQAGSITSGGCSAQLQAMESS